MVDRRTWAIELTGGEPALYDGLPELLEWLAVHRYTGCIKTNGTLPIPATGGFPRVAAWHDEFPKYYDIILIIKMNGWNEKAKYCKEHNILFKTIEYDQDDGCVFIREMKLPERMSFITPEGNVYACLGEARRQQNVEHALERFELPSHAVCQNCKSAQDFALFVEV